METDEHFSDNYDAALREALRAMRESGEFNPAMMEVIRKRLKDVHLDVVPTADAEETRKEYGRALRVVKGGQDRGTKSA